METISKVSKLLLAGCSLKMESGTASQGKGNLNLRLD